MSERKPYSQLVLPSTHLPADSEHAQPASARDSDVIDFRRSRPHGALVYDEERKGLIIEQFVVRNYEQQGVDDDNFSLKMLAMAAINTGFYDFARDASVMNRNIPMPELAINQSGGRVLRPSRTQFLAEAIPGNIEQSIQFATQRLDEFQKSPDFNNRKVAKLSYELGKTVSRTALLLGGVSQIEHVHDMDAFEAQKRLREHLTKLLEDARTIAAKPVDGHKPMGSHPSILQLANQDSDLSVYWRRNAPNEAVDLLEEARAQAKSIEESANI